MAFYSLPSNVEKQVAAYLTANYTGPYAIAQAFSTDAFSLPVILVKAGRFTEVEPSMHVYTGSLVVSVVTQADDVENPLAVHDETLATVYDLMSATDALLEAVNAPSSLLHVFSLVSAGFDQEAATGPGGERSLMSFLEFSINAQTLEVA